MYGQYVIYPTGIPFRLQSNFFSSSIIPTPVKAMLVHLIYKMFNNLCQATPLEQFHYSTFMRHDGKITFLFIKTTYRSCWVVSTETKNKWHILQKDTIRYHYLQIVFIQYYRLILATKMDMQSINTGQAALGQFYSKRGSATKPNHKLKKEIHILNKLVRFKNSYVCHAKRLTCSVISKLSSTDNCLLSSIIRERMRSVGLENHSPSLDLVVRP